MDDRHQLAQRLIEKSEELLNHETSVLQWRIREALVYMRSVEQPNQITLDHIRRYLRGENDNLR
ncbi:hypothetical protein [Streptomyces johnsoniae]|uniref:Uncharacterized protein n=1 Tax=Streptomyces johnsoniae TaxID=3075532 RepID=A0ABU2S1H4_9ACTN|nr:hypothetical protein [Streptomyces sp. DSM 41886]MDT0442294.1 hypothetical protein [Streptomyces sp. DSM 41886]